MSRWTDEDLLDALRRAVAADDALTTIAYRQRVVSGDPSVSTILDRFGSWSAALEAAGIGHDALAGRRWTADSAAVALAAWLDATGSVRVADYQADRRPDLPSEHTLRRLFSGWPAAVAAAQAVRALPR